MSANLQAVRLLLAQLSPDERRTLLAEGAPAPEKLLTRAEVAERFKRSERAIDGWARKGLLRKVRLPGSTRAVGFRAAEVEAVIRGEGKP